MAPLIGRVLDGQYFGALLFPNRYSPQELFVTNNYSEFTNVYLPLLSQDFLLNHLVETNSPALFKQLEPLDIPGKREFLAETQKVRPCGDCFYVPLRINNFQAGFLAIGREGLNCHPFSRNDYEIFCFISDFILEAFRRILYSEVEEEDSALLNAYGQVLQGGTRIHSACSTLFGERFRDVPGRGLSENSHRFNQALKGFLNPDKSPGSGDLWLKEKDCLYHLTFRNLPDPHFRSYFPGEPQLILSLRKRDEFPEKSDLLDFSQLETLYHFSFREKEVIRCLYRGFSNKDISLELKITESTVKRHIWNIFNKAGVESRTQLVFRLSV